MNLNPVEVVIMVFNLISICVGVGLIYWLKRQQNQ